MRIVEDIEMLEVVNDQDEVIGLEERSVIHDKGLLHREVHVWFVTPNREIIFQHRAKDKDTFPDLLDAAAGGHVDPGMSYEETAHKETEEETGVVMDPSKLREIKKWRKLSVDEVMGAKNNTFRINYAYLYEDDIVDLCPEEGKILGFEVWHIDDLRGLSPADASRFIRYIVEPDFIKLYEECLEAFDL